MKYRAILYDMDGVVNRQPDYFSRVYARDAGLDEGALETFFDAEFLKASVGRADLKDLIVKRNDLWQWSGTPEELLQKWFDFENCPDEELVGLIRQQRKSGVKAYLATIQEKYRTDFIRKRMFPDLFDDIFASCDLGFHKSEAGFFATILERVEQDIPGIRPDEIVYFDDNREGLITAVQLGIATYLYEGVEQVKTLVT
jgi:putative hydrolase of the HAD superfamily